MSAEPRRRRIIVLVIAAVVALATVGVGIYGLVQGPNHTTTTTATTPSSSRTTGGSAASGVGAAGGGPDPATLPKTDDPVIYAKAVARALFDWSTISGYVPSDYEAPVLADGDPSGDEIPGLIGDVASYEPTENQWTQLGTMDVVQTIQITSARVPSLWPEALAEAHGQLAAGTTAINIVGIRHRVGVWYGQKQVSNTPVSFTVFEACTPAFSRCHTLRLSQLNDPLG